MTSPRVVVVGPAEPSLIRCRVAYDHGDDHQRSSREPSGPRQVTARPVGGINPLGVSLWVMNATRGTWLRPRVTTASRPTKQYAYCLVVKRGYWTRQREPRWSRRGVRSEVVSNGQAGLVVRPGDLPSWSDAIKALATDVSPRVRPSHGLSSVSDRRSNDRCSSKSARQEHLSLLPC
jgi:hypothetical protein